MSKLSRTPVAILQLEHDPLDAELSFRKLESSGLVFSMTRVGSADDFKREVRENKHDVILCAYQLPDWTGMDAVRWLRSSGFSVPFILVTGFLSEDLAGQCIEAGATDYIMKGKMERLPIAVTRALKDATKQKEGAQAKRDLGHSERDLSQSERDLGHSERDLSQSERDLSQSERDLSQSERDLSQSKRDLSQSERDLSQSERDLSQSERDLNQSERDLSLSERQYASIVEGAPYGILRADDSGRIFVANPALIKMLGYESNAEVLNLNLETDLFVDPKERSAVLARVDEQRLTSHPEVKWRHKKGHTITVHLEGRRIEPESGGSSIYEAFAEDVTEQRVLQQQFLQAQKMEIIGRLAGGVAHDFNNLLMIIRGCAELLEYYKANPEKVGGYIKQIHEATSIAASVVQQLMAFSRKQAPEKRSLDFNAVLRDLRTLLPRLLGEDIQIVVTPGPALECVSADRAQIEQIILNLAVNARDAMSSGGKLTLATSNVCFKTPQVETGGMELPPGNYVLLSVADSGTGMDADVQSHIFEPFFTTKERGKGTGLGLATVHGIVKENQGFIVLDTAPGKGAKFNIYFPMTTVASEIAPAAPTALAGPGGSETILLVEDEVALREITAEYLQSRGYQLLCASSGLHALEICRTHNSPIDILMTDIIMPGIHGPELVKAALEMRPQMRVIYVSGYADRGMEWATPDGKAVFLRKPYSLDDLGEQIRLAVSSASLPPVLEKHSADKTSVRAVRGLAG
jgi:two-component system, cell cycle sensor histidine kinase and response regulator CckA